MVVRESEERRASGDGVKEVRQGLRGGAVRYAVTMIDTRTFSD